MTIAVDNLTIRCGGATLFRDISFRAASGQKLCIAGRSGSGKTTLLKALMGLTIADSGRIKIDQQELSPKTVWQLRHQMAYVSQEPDLGEGSTLERIRRPFGYHANMHLQWDSQKLYEYCETLQLDRKLLDREVSDLSGGEKQRIAIIIALLLDRPILLLDEPISAQDKACKAVLRQLLANDTSKTVLFVSHDEALLDIADATVDLDREGSHE